MQSRVDPFVFYSGNLIFLHFVDDALYLCPKSAEVDTFIQDLQDANFKVTDEGVINNYLRVRVTKRSSDSTFNCPIITAHTFACLIPADHSE